MDFYAENLKKIYKKITLTNTGARLLNIRSIYNS